MKGTMGNNNTEMKSRIYELLDEDNAMTADELASRACISKKAAVLYITHWKRAAAKKAKETASLSEESKDDEPNAKSRAKAKAAKVKAPMEATKEEATEPTKAKIEKPFQAVVDHVRMFHKDLKPISSVCAVARAMLVYYGGPQYVPRSKDEFAKSYLAAFESGELTGGKTPSERTVRNQVWYFKKLIDALETYQA